MPAQPSPNPLRRRPRRRRHAAGALLLAILVGAAVVAWWILTPRPVAPLERGWIATAIVLAGDGVAGWRDGDASRARFADPFGIAAAADGTIYVADAGDAPRIRAIARDGQVFTVAGGTRGFADGPGDRARFDTPSGLAIDRAGTLFVADTGNHAIRRITRDGHVSTLAGDGLPGMLDGRGAEARFNGPVGVAIDRNGRVLVADTYNDRIRAIAQDGTVTTLAGGAEPGAVDGAAAGARFDTPCGIAVDAAGRILVADTGNGLVRVLDTNGFVRTIDGGPSVGGARPLGIAAGADGDIFVTDDRGRVIEIAAGQGARILAGSSPGFRDGDGRDAAFRRPSGIAVADAGRLVVADSGNALVRAVVAPSRRDLRLPASPRIAPRFDAAAFAALPLMWPAAPMDGPHEVAGTIGEPRGSGAERFHAGIDVRVPDGTPVHAVRDGVVSSPISTGDFGSLIEYLRVGPVTYVHIRAGRLHSGELLDTRRFVPTYGEDGKLAKIRVRRGARFYAGETIATVNRFNHVHLNIGWPGEEHNPLAFRLVRFEDDLPPVIARGGIQLFDANGEALKLRARGRLVVSGAVRIVVDAWDQANGNRPNRRLGLYALGYQVLHRDGSPAAGFESARETIRFDRIAAGGDAPRVVFAEGSGIPFYGQRRTRFMYVVTNTFRDGVAAPGWWDTTALPPGEYTLRILAADIEGNVAVRNRDLPIAIVAPDGADTR